MERLTYPTLEELYRVLDDRCPPSVSRGYMRHLLNEGDAEELWKLHRAYVETGIENPVLGYFVWILRAYSMSRRLMPARRIAYFANKRERPAKGGLR